MEPERRERENEEMTGFEKPSVPTLCVNNCGFFGSSATNGLCSKCFKDAILSKSKAVQVVGTVVAVEEGSAKGCCGATEAWTGPSVEEEGAGKEKKKPPSRCGFCNKKVGLMGFDCRCGGVYCAVHRYSGEHRCPYDYKSAERDALAKANPIVKAEKVEKI